MLEASTMEEMDPVFAQLEECKLAAVVLLDDVEHAVPLARALMAGGVRAIELTLRTEVALAGLARLAAEVPEMLVGGGTVLCADQVKAVYEAGADFGVSPGTNGRVIAAAKEIELPFAAGIATPSDIEAALEFDCRVLKFFPADGMGGLSYLKGIAAPYRHLGLRYIPLGGVNEGNLAEYVASPDVLAVGGSWLAPKAMMQAKDWGGIEALAARASSRVSSKAGKR